MIVIALVEKLERIRGAQPDDEDEDDDDDDDDVAFFAFCVLRVIFPGSWRSTVPTSST